MLQEPLDVLLLGLLSMLTSIAGAWRAQISEFDRWIRVIVNGWVLVTVLLWSWIGSAAINGIGRAFLETPHESYSWRLVETEMTMIVFSMIAWICYRGLYRVRKQVLARRDARRIIPMS